MNRTFVILTFVLTAVIYHVGPWETERVGPVGVDTAREMVDVHVDSWTKEVVGSLRPVLVFFHSPSSAECQRLYPVLSDANDVLKGRVKFARIELASNASLGMQYQIGTTPSLVMFKNGLMLDTIEQESLRDFNTLEKRLLAYCD